ncbi:MAG: hypothetical protein LBM25_00090 [Bacteroidales bacterium]|nr:hypothetical protein [Bacteroidales bacterium]
MGKLQIKKHIFGIIFIINLFAIIVIATSCRYIELYTNPCKNGDLPDYPLSWILSPTNSLLIKDSSVFNMLDFVIENTIIKDSMSIVLDFNIDSNFVDVYSFEIGRLSKYEYTFVDKAGCFKYKTNEIIVISFDKNKFNNYFIQSERYDTEFIETMFDTHKIYLYDEELYKTKKELVVRSCCFRFEITDNGFKYLSNSCEGKTFKTKEELIKLYGKPE